MIVKHLYFCNLFKPIFENITNGLKKTLADKKDEENDNS